MDFASINGAHRPIIEAMGMLLVIAIAAAWVTLSLLGSEMQRQRQNQAVTEHIAARRAAKEAAAAIEAANEAKAKADKAAAGRRPSH
jgi:hypothetical protein